jgi:tripartite motif-containing protein 71
MEDAMSPMIGRKARAPVVSQAARAAWAAVGVALALGALQAAGAERPSTAVLAPYGAAGRVDVSPSGEAPPGFVFAFGARGVAPGQLTQVDGLARGPDGRIYVADTGNNRVQVFTAEGTFLYGWGTNGGGLGQFNVPMDLALDADGNVYVADSFNHRIQVFDPTGSLLRVFSQDYGFGLLTGIDVKNAQIFALDNTYNEVRVFDLFGQAPNTSQLAHIPVAHAGDAVSLAVSAQSDIYVLSKNAATVTKYTWRGDPVLEWGSPGSAPGQFREPVAIETDANGNVYVGDRNNFRIQKFDADGGFLCAWTLEGAAPGKYQFVTGLGAGTDRIYVGQAASDATGPCIYVYAPQVSIVPITWSDLKVKYR